MLLFQVSIALLIFCPVYMHFFLVETVESAPRRDQDSTFLQKVVMVLKKRYKSMRDAALTVISRYYFHVLCRQHLDNFISVNPLTFFVFVFVYLSIFMMPKTLFAFWLMSTISFSLFLVLFQSNTQRNFLCFLLL